MTVRLLAGVSALALALSAASGAMANPQNVFSDGNDTNVVSAAAATSDSGNARATSESFNSSQKAVSLQTLTQSNSGSPFTTALVETDATLGMNARIADSTQENAAGVVQASAQSGFQPQTQQAASIAAIGTVSIGDDDR